MAASAARVFASLVPAAGDICGDEFDSDRTVKPTSSQSRSYTRHVQVTGSAELSCPPDRATVTISLTNTKESVNDASNSITRRLEYILQTARQHGVKEADTSVRRHVGRDGDLYCMSTEVSVVFSDFEKMQGVRAVLLEKLDKSVCVGDPQFEHSSECLGLLRRVCATAVETARLKANDICGILGQTLGPTLLVQEEETREWGCGQKEGLALPVMVQQKVDRKLFCAYSRVRVIFELRPNNSTRKNL
ncbi:interleukin-1 receptor-associated kinase 1-binding protein 1 homolog isoform X2 [Brachyhypopomus gauderio]|uniref:interleukin-1 receptor-associated kinase 1-binding protein 1 homolog isoform X2 n=1 Tax=Brachyhypopomus gauderio TaxID=698409 RepID=UPI0040411E78